MKSETLVEVGSFHIENPRTTRCNKCGHTAPEGHGVYVIVGNGTPSETADGFCPQCFVSTMDKLGVGRMGYFVP